MSDREKDSDEMIDMFCEFCNKRERKNIPAAGYCTDCETYYCEICLDHHREMNGKHKILDKEDMPKDFCLEPCSEHPSERIKYYCQRCSMFACSACSSNHKRCWWGFYQLTKYTANFETSKEFKQFEKSLEELGSNIEDLATALKDSKRKVQNYKSDVKYSIIRQREEINALFDNLEKEINNYETVDKLAIEKDEEKAKLLKRKFLSVKSNIEDKKMSMSRIKLFMAMKKAIPETEKIKELLQELERDITKIAVHKYRYNPVKEKQTREKFGKLKVEKEKVKENYEWLGINMW